MPVEARQLPGVRSARLIVPAGYDVDPPRIELVGASEDVRRRVESAFAAFVQKSPQVSLCAAVNVLGARAHLWAREEKAAKKEATEVVEEAAEAAEGSAREVGAAENEVSRPSDQPPLLSAGVGALGLSPHEISPGRMYVGL